MLVLVSVLSQQQESKLKHNSMGQSCCSLETGNDFCVCEVLGIGLSVSCLVRKACHH